MPVTADLVELEPYRKYVAIADKVVRLRKRGMTQADIARAPNTSPRTVRRALALASEDAPTC